MSFDDFDPFLDPDAEALANKMLAFLKSKKGELLEPVRLKGKKPKYYWSIMEKSLCLIKPDAEMYVVPWKITEKGEYYVYILGRTGFSCSKRRNYFYGVQLMSDFIYLFIVMMFFLILYVLIGFELMSTTLLFLIFIILLGSRNENK